MIANIKNVMQGNTQIAKIMQGNNLVWQKASSNLIPMFQGKGTYKDQPNMTYECVGNDFKFKGTLSSGIWAVFRLSHNANLETSLSGAVAKSDGSVFLKANVDYIIESNITSKLDIDYIVVFEDKSRIVYTQKLPNKFDKNVIDIWLRNKVDTFDTLVDIQGSLIIKEHTYTKVKYLESNGTQYIDTERLFTGQHMRVETEFYVEELQASKALFGYQSAGGAFGVALLRNTGSTDVFPTGTSARYNIKQWNTYSFERDETHSKLQVNDMTSTNKSPYEFICDNSPLLFANKSRNNVVMAQALSGKVKFYNFFDNHVQVFEFRPYIDENNTPCLIDELTGVAYYNKGKGQFGYEKLDGTYVAPISVNTLDINSSDGDLGNTNVVYSDIEEPTEELTPEEIEEIERIRKENGL